MACESIVMMELCFAVTYFDFTLSMSRTHRCCR